VKNRKEGGRNCSSQGTKKQKISRDAGKKQTADQLQQEKKTIKVWDRTEGGKAIRPLREEKGATDWGERPGPAD